MIKKIFLLGVGITDASEQKILEYILQRLKSPQEKMFIVTPNAELIMLARHDLSYQDKLNSAVLSLPDGVGVFLGTRFLGHRLHERSTGVDFIEYVCRNTREKPLSIGFLGGRGGVAKRTADRLKEKYPWIKVAFVGEEWNFDTSEKVQKRKREEASTFAPLHSFSFAPIDLLFVAFGSPKQEEWIYNNLDRLPVKAAMGVGGSFDFISGAVPRAPQAIRAVGLEWLYRLIRQPWRLKRQLSLVEFVLLILREKFRGRVFH